MSKTERGGEQTLAGTEPLPPVILPSEWMALLGGQPRGVGLLHATERGTVVLVRESVDAIYQFLRPVRMRLHHDIYVHHLAPVIRTSLQLSTRGDHPVLTHTFTNIANSVERASYAALEEQNGLFILLYDDELRHRLSKRLPLNPSDRETVRKIITQAEKHVAGISQDTFDFSQAWAALIKTMKL